MRTLRSAPPQPLHLAIGIFDGVHLGHRAVVEAAVHSARANGALAAVLTFWPHPSTLFRPENPTRRQAGPGPVDDADVGPPRCVFDV